jgi:hypothetical protein
LRYGLAPLTASTATGIEAAAEDIGNAVAAMAAAGIDGTDAVVIARPELAVRVMLLAGARFTSQVLGSVALPARTVVVAAPVGLASAYIGNVQTEASKEVAIQYEDTTPQPIGTPGSPNVVAAPARDSWQFDVIGIRVRARATWAALPGAVQVIEGVNW